MSQSSQQDESHIIGEMFDVANISQPEPFQGIPGSVTPANIEILEPRPQAPPANNGLTADNMQPPAPNTNLVQENTDE